MLDINKKATGKTTFWKLNSCFPLIFLTFLSAHIPRRKVMEPVVIPITSLFIKMPAQTSGIRERVYINVVVSSM